MRTLVVYMSCYVLMSKVEQNITLCLVIIRLDVNVAGSMAKPAMYSGKNSSHHCLSPSQAHKRGGEVSVTVAG